MAIDPDWKKAQDKVAEALKKFEATRKDFWPRRFTDTYEARGNTVQSQPSDQWCLFDGTFFLVEVKSSHYPDKFYFKDVQNSQWIGARRVVAAGGRTVFMIVRLPGWEWFRIDGLRMWLMKEAGENGVAWSAMERIPKLTAEAILA